MADATRPLDDVMLAMDVVDTLRHRRKLVERELGADSRDAQLIDRLREIYAAQGIDVPDSVLAEGVTALKEERFVYEPPPPGLSRTLAHLYVSRRRWGIPALAGIAIIIAGFIAYDFGYKRPQEARQAEQVIALAETIPNELNALNAEIETLARDQDAVAQATALRDRGLTAAAAGTAAQAEAALADLKALKAQLNQTYEVRIVSRPGTPSGVWRVPDNNPNARNFYLIVEARDPNGDPVSVTVTSEEDGGTKAVEMWGVRVDESAFNAVRADKEDDGIVQDSLLGVKERGALTPDYVVPTTGAAIFEW